MPQAFTGFEVSVQLIVSLLHEVVANPRMPMPERMFHVATLKVIGPPTWPVTLLRVGSAGEWLHATATIAATVNGAANRRRLTNGNTPLSLVKQVSR
jgi:hypothetical protein